MKKTPFGYSPWRIMMLLELHLESVVFVEIFKISFAVSVLKIHKFLKKLVIVSNFSFLALLKYLSNIYLLRDKSMVYSKHIAVVVLPSLNSNPNSPNPSPG